MSSEGEAPQDAGLPLPFWARFLKQKHTVPPDARSFAFSVVSYYVSTFINFGNACISMLRGDFLDAVILLVSVFLPGVLVGWTMKGRWELSDTTKPHAVKWAIWMATGSYRGIVAWNYAMRGEEPRWDDVANSGLTAVAIGQLLSLCANLNTVATGAVEPGLNTYLIAGSSLSGLSGVLFISAIFHTSKGPPGNLDKYRLFDLDAPGAAKQVLHVWLTDVCGIMYRLGMAALLAVVTGYGTLGAFLCFSGCLSFMMNWETFSQLPLPTTTLMALCAGTVFTTMTWDTVWEPSAAMDMYSRHCFAFRLIQAFIAVCLIARSYEVIITLPGVQWVWITIAFTLLNFLLWSWACGVGLFVLFAEQREEKRLMAQAFFNMLAQMKKKKAEEAEAKKKEEAEKQTEGTDSK